MKDSVITEEVSEGGGHVGGGPGVQFSEVKLVAKYFVEHGVVRGGREGPVIKGSFEEVYADDLVEGRELIADGGVCQVGGVRKGDVIGKGAGLKKLREHKLVAATVGVMEG